MRPWLGVVVAALLMLGPVAVAQSQTSVDLQPTPVPDRLPFQTVTVDGVLYTVDPFYLSACFIASRTEDIALPTSITVQCFLRDGQTVVAVPRFTTSNEGIAELVHVGEVMYGYPQAAMEGQTPP